MILEKCVIPGPSLHLGWSWNVSEIIKDECKYRQNMESTCQRRIKMSCWKWLLTSRTIIIWSEIAFQLSYAGRNSDVIELFLKIFLIYPSFSFTIGITLVLRWYVENLKLDRFFFLNCHNTYFKDNDEGNDNNFLIVMFN